MSRSDAALPKQLHPLLANARRRVAVAFAGLFGAGYVVVLMLWLPTQSRLGFWEWYQVFALALLVGLVTFQMALGAAARAAPAAKTLLVLRRFHNDPLAMRDGLFRPQKLRMAPVFENLGIVGHRVVVLRDTMLIGDMHLAVYWAPLILLANMLSPVMLAYFALLIGMMAALSHLGASDTEISMAMLAYFFATAMLFLIRPMRNWLEYYTQSYMQFTRRWFLRGHKPRDIECLAKLLARKRSGVTAIRTKDVNWRDFARHCIETADAICFDLRAPSENCDTEIRMIAETRRGGHVVWLAPEEDAETVRQTAEGYIVRGVAFPGAPYVLELPEKTKPSLFNDDDAFLRRMSRLLHLIDQASAR